MHGELAYDGVRLAGQWPLGQLKACEAAGATIFGPAVNVNTTKSLPWNTARTCALIKPVTAEATIPVHANAGMGVGGVAMTPYPPADATSRASRALVDICRIDGL
jgi:dimethylamine--corrinoid protein Co-methyltransferase